MEIKSKKPKHYCAMASLITENSKKEKYKNKIIVWYVKSNMLFLLR